MHKLHVLFLPYKLHFRFFLFALAKRLPVTVLLPPEKSLPDYTDLKGMRIKYKQFGADVIKRYNDLFTARNYIVHNFTPEVVVERSENFLVEGERK